MELHIVAMAEEGEPDKFILYRPLARLAFVGNQAMADLARAVAADVPSTGAIASNRSSEAMAFLEDIGFLQPDAPPPPAQCNEFRPTTAVLLMTNACQLRCVYCYAASGEAPAEHLTPEQGRAAIDFVCASALAQARPHFEVSFHGGGEPTLAWSVLTTCVAHARGKPLLARIGLTSNGVWSPSQTGYLLEQMDELTLSFDGAPTTQDAKRPLATGRGSAATLLRTIAALDRCSFAYAIRMTATAPWQHFPADVRFICEQTGCRTIQVEPAFNTERRGHPQGDAADCRGFADAFLAAHEIAAAAGCTLFYSGARLGLVTDRFCSAPYDALIVTPRRQAGRLLRSDRCASPAGAPFRPRVLRRGRHPHRCGGAQPSAQPDCRTPGGVSRLLLPLLVRWRLLHACLRGRFGRASPLRAALRHEPSYHAGPAAGRDCQGRWRVAGG